MKRKGQEAREKRKKHPRAWLVYLPFEDEYIVRRWNEGATAKQIAKEVGRPAPAICQRIVVLRDVADREIAKRKLVQPHEQGGA